MVEIAHASDNSQIAYVDGRPLLSKYNPAGEIKRFVDRVIPASSPGAVVVLGDVFLYIGTEIANRLPETTVISILYDPDLAKPTSSEYHFALQFDSIEQLRRDLEAHLTELDMQSLSVVEWDPSSRTFPKKAETARQILTDLLNTQSGNIATTAYFGKRWIRNAVDNFLMTDRLGTFSTSSKPVLIAASGPTLRTAIATIKKNRAAFELWSLPSAICGLYASDIIPDLVILTDPGYYSLLHFHPLAGRRKIPVAMPLTAARGVWKFASRVLPLNQGFFFEETLLSFYGKKAMGISPNGSVAGTALELSSRHGSVTVFAGLDFSTDDIHTHIQPHMFDMILDYSAQRDRPVLAQKYERLYKQHFSPKFAGRKGPLESYASWFERYLGRLHGNVYRLCPSKVHIKGFTEIEPEDLESIGSNGDNRHTPRFSPYRVQTSNERRETLINMLQSWIDSLASFCGRYTDLPVTTSSFFTQNELLLTYFVETRTVLGSRSHALSVGDLAEPIDKSVIFLRGLVNRLSL